MWELNAAILALSRLFLINLKMKFCWCEWSRRSENKCSMHEKRSSSSWLRFIWKFSWSAACWLWSQSRNVCPINFAQFDSSNEHERFFTWDRDRQRLRLKKLSFRFRLYSSKPCPSYSTTFKQMKNLLSYLISRKWSRGNKKRAMKISQIYRINKKKTEIKKFFTQKERVGNETHNTTIKTAKRAKTRSFQMSSFCLTIMTFLTFNILRYVYETTDAQCKWNIFGIYKFRLLSKQRKREMCWLTMFRAVCNELRGVQHHRGSIRGLLSYFERRVSPLK